MGGLAPGIGGFELVIVALVALLVVGPRDLPLLMRKVGKAMGKARAMANDFRASFDEMARQSELDELRKEVEALRTGKMVPLGEEADRTFKDIQDDLNRPLDAPAPQPALAPPAETPPATTPAPEPPPKTPVTPKPAKPRKTARKKTEPGAKAAPAAPRKRTMPTGAKPAPRKRSTAKKTS